MLSFLASGLGLATAKAFAKDGWKVAIVDLNEASGQQAAQELNGKFYKTNATDYDSLANTFAQVFQDYGRLDMGR